MSVAAAPPRASWAEAPSRLVRRTAALSLVELQKLRHDHTELVTRTCNAERRIPGAAARSGGPHRSFEGRS